MNLIAFYILINILQVQANAINSTFNCPRCGLSKRTRIVGGHHAVNTEFPWLVSVEYNGFHRCGGTLINNKFVLTAAHCVHKKVQSKFAVFIPSELASSKREKLSWISACIVHPNFDPDTFNCDIALLHLNDKVNLSPGIHPVCIMHSTLKYNTSGEINATIIGWGATDEDGPSKTRLHQVEIPLVPLSECKNVSGMKGHLITDNMICAGFVEGIRDACQGDSGGPMIIKRQGAWQQFGIISWGIGCARKNFLGVYTRVSVFLDWIYEHVTDGECF